jgi:catechol 2,3-dioxygenase-like lactoylglutathione lyase family enzyme
MATVRYIVHDVDAAVGFYTSQLGFTLRQQYGPAMAVLAREDLELWCAGPSASASKPMPDGRRPEAGGWARIVLAVSAMDDLVARLRGAGVACRSDIVSGPGGRQILIEDPSGNPIELFEAKT